MLEKIKKMFENKEKRIENLVSILIILIITLIVINKILDDDKEEIVDYKNESGVELAQFQEEDMSSELEKRLENILSKISGVGKVSVMITYKDNGSIIPLYNVNSNISTTEEKDSSGASKIIKTEDLQKEIITKNDENIIIEKKYMPLIEGAIVAAARSK